MGRGKDLAARMYEATRGPGLGASILSAFVHAEVRGERLDWREAAIYLADAVDRMHKLATDAITMAPAPIVIGIPRGESIADLLKKSGVDTDP